MLLKPINPTDSNIIKDTKLVESPAASILEEVGLVKKVDGELVPTKSSRKREAFIDALDASGGDLESVAREVSNVMRFSEDEMPRLRAAELNLKLRGIIDEAKDMPVPQVTININNANGNLINLIMPRVVTQD